MNRQKHCKVIWIAGAILLELAFLGIEGCGVRGDPIPYIQAYPEVVPENKNKAVVVTPNVDPAPKADAPTEDDEESED